MSRQADGTTRELTLGERVGHYLVEYMLGEGGMARVYCAMGPGETRVALKIVKGDVADETFRRRFDREARMAAKVEHPHVVAVLDAGESDGIPYMAQQFVRGGSLDERIQQEGPLGVDETVTLCGQIAAGLDALHEHDLVHRDLKPGNVLLDEEGNAYITDFGLAKDYALSVLTKAGQAVGSMDYMAPEQVRGHRVDATTDVYALGCVLCACLRGRPPFADREGMQILWAHLQDEPPDPGAGREDVSADLSWAITRALEKDPERRPASAGAYARIVRFAANPAASRPGAVQ